jgi:hypothetical protein
MRKLSIFLIAVLMIPTATWAAVKPMPGNSCNKIGSVQISGGFKFTCIKSGKKTVWNNGVRITGKPSTASNSKNPTQTPTPFSSPSISASLRKLQNIWQEINQIKNEKTVPSLALDIRYSPNVNQTYAKSVLGGMSGAAQFWQSQFLPEKPFPVLVFSEKDENWYRNQLIEFGIGTEFVNQKVEQYKTQAKRTGSKMNAAGLNGYQNVNWFEFNFGTDFGTKNLGPDARLFELGSLKVGPHEYTHAVQSKLVDGQSSDYMPCWFIEGGAEFYGMVLGAKDLQTLKEMRYNQVWERYYLNFNGMGYEPAQGWEAFLEENGAFNETSKPSNECGPNGAYPVGSLATQYLYELKGQKGIVDFMNGIQASKDWRKTILNVYGISWTQMKKEIASYIRLVVAQTPK